MREILFRAKETFNGEWVEGYYEFGYDSETEKPAHYMWVLNHTEKYGDMFMVIPETVGQYTGLTDKNGKKIFEGDIVRFGKNIYQIIFSGGSFALYDEQGEMISKIGGHNDHCYSFMDLYIECCWEDGWAYDVEIIGNIHDNPELLEVK